MRGVATVGREDGPTVDARHVHAGAGARRPRLTRWVLWVLLISSAAAWSVNGAAVIVGGSMEPALSAGDVVLYRRGPAIAQGELVAFSSRSWPRTVVHRAVGILPDGSIRTRGDANPIDDLTPVPREAVRGRVIVVVPAGSAASAVARGADRVVDSCANRIRRR